ncbi:MAG: tRNA (adenosine(37)-N6)-threonylcarbamoyltransferase complex ATPase subunit type 1 TsaE [Terriglobia bacterium]
MLGYFGKFLTHSPQETFEMAYTIGRSLENPARFFLEGDLGAGKTVFAKGLICGLGQSDPDDIPSPSYNLVNEYALRFKVYHIDLYRLDSKEDLATLDLEEIFAESAVIIVEWAEKLAGWIDDEGISVKLVNRGENFREVAIFSRKGTKPDEA